MTKPSLSLNNADLGEEWNTHPTIEWLYSHKKLLLILFLALLALLLVASRLIALRTLDAENDFFQAQTAFTQFQQNTSSSQDASAAAASLEQLDAIMQRHPELKPKYQGALAQTLLIDQQVPQAQAFAQDIFKRTSSEHLQLYQDYSQTSLLIGAGNYTEALQQAQQLKSTLDQLNENSPTLLFVFNLIRLGLLYQQTGQSQQELKSWEELQNQPQRLEAVVAANDVLKVGQASLSQYIQERKKTLTP